jgi:hypothetical protein
MRRLGVTALPILALAVVLVLGPALVVPPVRARKPMSMTGSWLPPYVHLAVDTEPPGARVYLLGRALPLGYTPIRAAIPGSSAPLTLLFVRNGQAVATREVVPTTDVKVRVILDQGP